MTLQTVLNNEAINRLPLIKYAISLEKQFEANQMTERTIKEVCISLIPLDEMTKAQIRTFENELLKIFKFNGWITYPIHTII